MAVMEQARKTYNKLMNDCCREWLAIGQTENCTVDNMVNEVRYLLDQYNTEGCGDSEGMHSVRELVEEYNYSKKSAEQLHSQWVKETSRMKYFIKKYGA